jgi:hypothetical protein
MAKEEHEGKKHAKKHLHEIRSEETEDGHIIHHHTYKKKKGDAETEPERKNVAVSSTPEEAGQHTVDQFAMNQQPQVTPDAGAAGGGEPGGEEAGGGAGAAAPEEEM